MLYQTFHLQNTNRQVLLLEKHYSFSVRQRHLHALHWPSTKLSQSCGRKQAANTQVPVLFPSQLPPACPLLAPWLLNSWPHGCKRKARGVFPNLTSIDVVRLCSSMILSTVAGSQGRSSHFPPKGQ